MYGDRTLLIFTLTLLPLVIGSLRFASLRYQRDREWEAAYGIWQFEKITITHHANGDISFFRNRGPGVLYLTLGAAVMLFSVPVSIQLLPKIIPTLNFVFSGEVLTGIVAGFPMWVMFFGLVLLTFAGEWFMTEDTIISNHSGLVKTQSFWTRWTRSWTIKTFHALHHATDGKETAIYLKFKSTGTDKQPLALGTLPYTEAAHALTLLRKSLNLPTTSEIKSKLGEGTSPWA